jgi:glycosyltransferase involved in cell wall biosynthesis
MTSPLFSIVLPTRQRHNTLKYAIQTVLDQTYKDFELIVMDNKSTEETRLVVESFADDRIKYHYSEERLTMSENWEKGLSFAEGEFIFFLGDDDGMLPDALEVGARILKDSEVEILSWDRNACFYFWKDSILDYTQNILSIILTPPRFMVFDSAEALNRVYNYKASYRSLPMIYSSFIHRDLIYEVMLVHGKYFCHNVPDVYSGIVNAYFSESYLFSSRPLSMAGSSKNSTGASYAFPHISKKAMSDFNNEIQSVGGSIENHSALLTDYDHAEIKIADTFLRTKDLFFRENNEINLNFKNFLVSLSSAFGANPETYERETSLILELADKYHIPQNEVVLPKKRFEQPSRITGIFFQENGCPSSLRIDCDIAGVNDIYKASKLAFSILGSI